MNTSQFTGSLKDVAGRVQEKAGKLLGNRGLQAKGARNRTAGRVQKTFGDAKEILKGARDAITNAARGP